MCCLIPPDDQKGIEITRILSLRQGRPLATPLSRVLKYQDVARVVIGVTSKKLIYALMR